jgi:hypothetical protein
MKTEEKLDLIAKLLVEVAQEFDVKAEQIKEFDLPLYRMLTEGGSYYLKEMHKGLYSSGQLNTFKKRLEVVNKLLIDKC